MADEDSSPAIAHTAQKEFLANEKFSGLQGLS